MTRPTSPVVNPYEARIQTAWFVPSVEFGKSKMGKNRRFQANCPPDPDAYSYGDDWNVCWLAQPDTRVSPTATSPNPFPHASK